MSASPEERGPTLDELEAWARDPSGENWRNLLRTLTDLFLTDVEAHAAQYGDAYSEVVCRLLDEVAEEVRAELSARVAPLGKFPNKVVLRLAHDETSVARPILEHSPVLQEADLIDIVDMMLPEHSLAISRRKQLGRKITDVLAKRGDAETIRTMASNPGAEFSERTYRLVAEKAKTDPALQERLIDRKDLTQAVAVQITPFLSEELKARLKALDEPEAGSLLESLTEFTGEAAKKTLDRKLKIEAYASVEQVRAGNATIDAAATDIAKGGKVGVLCLFVSGVAGIADKTVTSAFMNTNGKMFAILCKGLKMSPEAFAAVAQLRTSRLGLSEDDAAKYIDSYEKLSAEDAAKSLASLRSDAKASGDDKGPAGKKPTA